jgi:hypothetical protein
MLQIASTPLNFCGRPLRFLSISEPHSFMILPRLRIYLLLLMSCLKIYTFVILDLFAYPKGKHILSFAISTCTS